MRIRWRGLELPSRVICNRETLTDTFGEFHVEPFERGFGHTVGNSLRRILLSSLEGSAVTSIKIHGVQHEFSSIPGMVDDITDLVLNVKLLVVKNHSESQRTIRIAEVTEAFWAEVDYIEDYERIQAFLRNSTGQPLAEPEPMTPAPREIRVAIAV